MSCVQCSWSTLLMKILSAIAVAIFLPFAAVAAVLININTADSAALETLKGIGPSKAHAIIEYRTEHGPFATIEDIQNVSGIGTVTYNNIKDFITVGDTHTQTQAQAQTQAPQPVATVVAPPTQTLQKTPTKPTAPTTTTHPVPRAQDTQPKTVHAAAVSAAASGRDVAWSYLLALTAIIAVGAWGAYYARTSPRETASLADEFEIE